MQPGNNDYHIIERPDGTSAGFTTYVEGMLNLALDRGLNITFNARVISVNQTASGFQLTLATGKVRLSWILLRTLTNFACGKVWWTEARPCLWTSQRLWMGQIDASSLGCAPETCMLRLWWQRASAGFHQHASPLHQHHDTRLLSQLS